MLDNRLDRLCGAVGEHAGTFLEGAFEGGLDRFSDEEVELVAAMSAAAGRSINWNVLTVDSAVPDRVPRQLAAADRAAELGGRVVALTMPVLVPMNMSFGSFCALWLMPGWGDILRLPPAELRGLLRPGMKADIAIFDPAQVKDLATFEKPHQYAAGFSHVLVNGQEVFDGNAMTAARPGVVLYGPAKR